MFAGLLGIFLLHQNKQTESYRHQHHRRATVDILDEDSDLPPLFPLQPLDYAGFACAVVGLMLAAGSGIGGGGILVPIYILVLNFPIKHAIPLASVTILGGAVANNLLNARKSHPVYPSRPCIDWDLIVQMEPMTMAGALVGAEVNEFLPEIVVILLLLILLSITAYKTLMKAQKMYENETAQIVASKGEAQKLVDQEDPEKSEYGTAEAGQGDGTHQIDSYTRYQGWLNATGLTGLFVVVTIMNFLKGAPEAGGGPLGLERCGRMCFWFVDALILLVILVFATAARAYILRRIKSGGPVCSDIEWDESNTVSYPAMSAIAGLVAGLFGIGGGIIKGPLMLALGVHPAVASATSAGMILFTSATATVTYSIFGLLVYDYAACCLSIGFVATLVGQTIMHYLMQRYQRDSYIAFCIGIVVGMSAVLMTVESVIAIGHTHTPDP